MTGTFSDSAAISIFFHIYGDVADMQLIKPFEKLNKSKEADSADPEKVILYSFHFECIIDYSGPLESYE